MTKKWLMSLANFLMAVLTLASFSPVVAQAADNKLEEKAQAVQKLFL